MRGAHDRVGSRQRGFTLLELMIVILIASMLVQLVVMNLGALIPGAKIQAEANKLRAVLAAVRSEAMLRGKNYKLQLDLDRDRYQIIMPAEDALTASEPVTEEMRALHWEALDPDVDAIGVQTGGTYLTIRRELQEIEFDAHGFSADTSIFLQHRQDKALVFTIQVPGLSGDIRVVDGKGREMPLQTVKETDF